MLLDALLGVWIGLIFIVPIIRLIIEIAIKEGRKNK